MHYNQLVRNYHDCKLEVYNVQPGALSSFIYAYCFTPGIPKEIEPYPIRKKVSFTELKKHVIENICNDFSAWYDNNICSTSLLEVLKTIINNRESRHVNAFHIRYCLL